MGDGNKYYPVTAYEFLLQQKQATIDRLAAELAECYRATGSDPYGNEDWRLAERASKAVCDARRDHEAECDKYEDRLTAERTENERLRDLVEMAYMEGWVDRSQPGHKGMSWEACFARSNPYEMMEAALAAQRKESDVN